MLQLLLLLLLLIDSSSSTYDTLITHHDDDIRWKFLKSYPKHVIVRRVRDGAIRVDGVLNESDWHAKADWKAEEFVDITNHKNQTYLNHVPSYQQASIAVLYDSHSLYVAAKLREPFTYAEIPCSHNGPAVPYKDNDFEVFVDPSGSTEFYKEFEINALNATYDVNWGVPDQAGLSCSNNKSILLPVCVNTSSPFYSGSWSMYNNNNKTGKGGLRTATSSTNFKTLDMGNGEWIVEIAFPLRNGSFHGGLLDTEDVLSSVDARFNYERFDPTRYDLREKSLYWSADFARTVHPRKYYYTSEKEMFMWCPLSENCSISRAESVSLARPNAEECSDLSKEDKSMLGSDPNYGCYFEWVLQDLGPRNTYMHRPLSWSFLEFSENSSTTPCGNLAFPVRHLLRILHIAQKNHFISNNNFTQNVTDLLAYCDENQDVADLQYALTRSDIFDLSLVINSNTTSVLNTTCTSHPCYKASVRFVSPELPHTILVGHINENRRLWFESDVPRLGCLF